MRRIWVEATQIKSPRFELTEEAFHHAISVSRFRVGEEFEIVSGRETAVRVRLIEIKKKSALVEILSERQLPIMSRPYVNLAFAIPKWPVFEEVLEKAVELGVHTIQPLFTEFSFIKTQKDWPVSRQERWQKIIRGATEQSGRGLLMQINEPMTLANFGAQLNRNSDAQGLFAYEGESSSVGPASGIQSVLAPLRQKTWAEVWAIVGSEGGFSAAEAEVMRAMEIPSVSLGPQILRAETACFAMVSVIKYELGLMK